jgi:photosystem II stability/assembly factor-like uncharacterized protein
VTSRQKNKKRNTKSHTRKGVKLPNDKYLKDGASRRQRGTTLEYFSRSKNKPLSNIRLSALKQTKQMPITDEYNWLQIGPTCIPFGETDSPARVLVSGRITSIVVHPKKPEILYVAAAQGGVWKTTDDGRNWKPTSDGQVSLAIGALAIDPKEPEVLYAGTGEGNLMGTSNPMSYYGCGLLKTKNGGKEWELKGEDTFNGARFFRLAVNPVDTHTIFAATSKGVYRTLDGGDEWKLMIGLPEITGSVKAASDLIIDPNNCQRVYAAFWADGIYKTENANDDNPEWVKISKGISASSIGRIALGISKTNSDILFTLMSNGLDGRIEHFYMSENSGSTWISIDLPEIRIGRDLFNKEVKRGIGFQGHYNLNIIVDPEDSNVVYLSGVPLLKAIRNPRSGQWTFIDIGRNIHTDNHAFAFHPTDTMKIFTGNDGGIYKSTDGGITWDDTLNEGLCITQFEFMDQHPDSDAVVIAGTQDNGTLQFRNNSVFYFCDESDGGFAAIDPENPNIVFHERFGPSIMRSDEGGMFGLYENGGSWKPLGNGNHFGGIANGTSLFFPPFTLDQSDSNNIALGTKNIYIYDQRQKKWDEPEQNKWEIIDTIELSSKELISAINYVDSNLIYVGTTAGKIFLLKKINNKWTSHKLESNNDIVLPDHYICDIATYRENKYLKNSTIIVALGGFIADKDPPRVWRGEISDDKIVKWKDISGNDNVNNTSLPNSPANAIAIDFNNHDTIYLGTDIGVFRTTNGGESWKPFGIGLPKCAVLDMRLLYYKDDHNSMRLLRVVTHGRGMWEVELDKRNNKNTVDLYVRDHIMDTGRFTPSLSGFIKSSFEDPLRNIKYVDKHDLKFDDDYDYLFWWMCADIKVDPPFYQMDMDDVDYVKFEYRIRNKNPIPGRINRIYVQVHNRGVKDASNVSIKLLYAKVINRVSDDRTKPFEPRLPDIPQNFWTDFPNNSADLGLWKQIGEKKSLPDGPKTLTNVEPTVLCWEWETPKDWEWETPLDANGPIVGRVGLLVVIDSMEDPIPEENKKIFDIGELVRNEKHIGVRVLEVGKNKI